MMKNDDIAENVIKRGKEGVKQNIIEALDEFCDDFADEMWEVAEEIKRLEAENAALRERLGKWIVDNEIVMEPRVKDGKIYYVISRKERRIVTHYICTELTPEAAEARLKELKGGEK